MTVTVTVIEEPLKLFDKKPKILTMKHVHGRRRRIFCCDTVNIVRTRRARGRVRVPFRVQDETRTVLGGGGACRRRRRRRARSSRPTTAGNHLQLFPNVVGIPRGIYRYRVIGIVKRSSPLDALFGGNNATRKCILKK